MRLDSLTPSIDVQPGIETSAIVRVSNDRPGPARYSIRVHGLGGEIRSVDVPGAPVAPGHACELEIRLAVPDTIGSGSHTVAIEIHSDRPEESAGLVDVTLTIGSLEQVVVRVDPDIIRGGRRTRFDIEIINRRVEPAEIELSGSGPLLAVDVGVPQLVVEPGEQVRVPAWVHGPEHRSGDPLHHVLTITARGGSTPTYATAAFHQRAAFPGGLRRAIAIFAIISLWLGVAMGLAWWWIGHDDGGRFADNPPASTVTEGSSPDGQPEGDGSSDGGDGSGTDGSGNDGSTDGSGSGSDAEGAGANEGAEAVPTDGQIKGTVKTPKQADSVGVQVSLTRVVVVKSAATPLLTPPALGFGAPIADSASDGMLTEPVPTAAPTSSGPTKLWPARYGIYQPASQGVRPVTTTINADPILIDNEGGSFAFPAQPLHQSYELNFQKAGFDSKSIIVEPNEDGTPLDIDVELEPGKGALGGIVTGPSGPLGGVKLLITDGGLVFEATSSTDPTTLGRWQVQGLSTPAHYTVQASRDGFGTAVIAQELGNDGEKLDLVIPMSAGVGSILGRVTGEGEITGQSGPLGGLTLTVAGGGVSRTTSTLTQGDVGSYAFTDLPIPGTYVVGVTAPGYLPQTREVHLTGNAGGINFHLTRTTGGIIGIVRSHNLTTGALTPLGSAGVQANGNDLEVRTITKEDGTKGLFDLAGLPPGDYLLTFSRFSHIGTTMLVTVRAGQTTDLGFVDLAFSPTSGFTPLGGFNIAVTELDPLNGEQPLGGWTLTYTKRPATIGPTTTYNAAASESEKQLGGGPPNGTVPIGTYDLTFTKSGYREFKKLGVSVGMDLVPVKVQMLKLGQAFGHLYDSSKPPTNPDLVADYTKLTGYAVSILNLDGSAVNGQATLPVDQNGWTSRDTFNGTLVGLESGDFRLKVNTYPVGFYVDTTQPMVLLDAIAPIDPAVTQPGQMQFTIPDSSAEQVGPLMVAADPYPTISGHVTLQTTSSVVPDDTPVNVVLNCGPTAADQVTVATMTADGGADYTFTNVDVDPFFEDGQTTGRTCTVTVADVVVDGDPDRTFVGTSSPSFILTVGTDPVVPLVLVERESLGGPVVWMDNGVDPAAEVAVDPAITVSRPAGTVIRFDTAADGSRVAVTDVNGADNTTAVGSSAWGLDGQLGGTTTYTVTVAGFVVGTFDITIDEVGVISVAGSEDVGASRNATSGAITLTLTPLPGSIAGVIHLISSTLPDVAEPAENILSIDAQGPGGAATTPVQRVAILQDLFTYVVNSCNSAAPCLPAGTWTTTINPPTGYVTDDGSPLATTELLEPDADIGRTTTLVETATLNVTVLQLKRDGTTAPFTGNALPTVTVSTTADSSTLAGTVPAPGIQAADDQGHYPITMLAVDRDNATTAVTYQLTVTLDRAAFSEAIASIDGVSTPISGGSLAVTVIPGQTRTVVIHLPSFATLNGVVKGANNGATTTLSHGSGLKVTYQEVDPETGAPIDDDNNPATGPREANYNVDDSFTISAEAGCYQIVVSHPNYEAPTRDQVPDGPIVIQGNDNCPEVGGFPTYYVASKKDVNFPGGNPNPVTPEPFQMTIKKGAIQPRVLNGSLGVDAASVRVLTSGPSPVVVFTGTTKSGPPASTAGTLDTADGTTGLNLWPGDYTFEVTKIVSGEDKIFPIRLTVRVPEGNSTTDRTLVITANTVSVGGTINGTDTVTAQNSADRPIELPAGATATRNAFVPPGSHVTPASSTSIPNNATEDDLATSLDLDQPITASGIGDSKGSYTYTDLPVGVYSISFSEEDGYSTPAAVGATVSNTTDAAIPGSAVYEAANVTLSVRVYWDNGTSGDFSDDTPITTATVNITPPFPANATAQAVTHQVGDPSGTYSLGNLVPEVETYGFSITAPGYGSDTTPRRITPQPDGTQTVDVRLAVNSIEITGTVTRLDSTNGTPTTPPASAQAFLYDSTDLNNPLQGPFDVTSGTIENIYAGPGSYQLDIMATGYRTVSAIFDITAAEVVPGGTESVGTLQLKKQFALVFTVTNSGNAAVGDATVTMKNPDDTINASGETDTTTGKVTLNVVAGDPMHYSVYKDGYALKEGDANPAVTLNINVTLDASIRGTAFRTGGNQKMDIFLCLYTTGYAACNGTTDVMASVESNATTGAYQFRANPGHYWVKAVAGGDHAGVEIFVLEDSGKISQDNSTVISMPGIDTRINAPTAVTSTQGLNGRSLTLSWTLDSGLTTEVRIAGGTWTSVSGTSQLFTGLTPSTSYTFELRTKSSSGYSSPVFSTQSTGPVTAPQALTLTADSDSISASWTAVATLSYQVRIYKTGDTPSANDWVDADSTSGHTFTGLDASTSYVVEVRAFISTFFSAISSDTISTDA